MKKMILLAVAFVAFIGVSNVSAQTEWQQQRGPRHMEMGNRFDGHNMRGNNEFRNDRFAYGRERFERRDRMMRRDNRNVSYMRQGYNNNCGQQMMYR